MFLHGREVREFQRHLDAAVILARDLSYFTAHAGHTLENLNESTVHQMHGSGDYFASAIDTRAVPFTYTGTYK
jgi:hypothetical protein